MRVFIQFPTTGAKKGNHGQEKDDCRTDFFLGHPPPPHISGSATEGVLIQTVRRIVVYPYC